MDGPPNFAQLLQRPGVREHLEIGSRFGLLAFHGGLENGTAEIATRVAERTGASLYLVVQPPTLRWHVPSALVSPAVSPRLASFLDHVEVALAVHGYGRHSRPADLLIGGRNRVLAAHVGRCLAATMSGFRILDDLGAIPVEMRGVHPDNPVNRPRGGGAQLELPHRARGSSALHRRLGDPAPGLIDGLAAAVTSWLMPDAGNDGYSTSKLPPARQ